MIIHYAKDLRQSTCYYLASLSDFFQKNLLRIALVYSILYCECGKKLYTFNALAFTDCKRNYSSCRKHRWCFNMFDNLNNGLHT